MNPSIPPFKIPLGPIEVTGYGLMMMVGFLMAGWLVDRELRRRGLNTDYAADMTVAAVIGGIIGGKLWWVALTGDMGSLFSRSGLVWYGGFVGGTLAVIINGWRLKVPTRWTAHLVAPALAAAYPLGRIGCFMVGDDYGIPTTVPWGVKFPQGLPPTTASGLAQFGVAVPEGIDPTTVLAVHPTQLYEVALMLLAFMVLWKLRTRVGGAGWLFGLYLVFAGTERFLIEFLRAKDDRLLGTFTIAQATSIGLILVGAFLILQLRALPDPEVGPHLSRAARASA